MSITESLEALRTALEAKRLPCNHQLGDSCECNDGYPDPAYAGLLSVARERCKHANSAWRDTAFFKAFCPDCHVEWTVSISNDTIIPTGYITRTTYWEQAPKGALRGALEDAMPEGYWLARVNGFVEVWEHRGWEPLLGVPGIDDLAAVKAVLAWVEQEIR